MAERNFDAEHKDRSGHTFTLAGRKFTTFPGLSVTVARNPGEREGMEPIERVCSFIRALLTHESKTDWDEMLADSNVYIDAGDLLDVSSWLSEIIMERLQEEATTLTNGDGTTSEIPDTMKTVNSLSTTKKPKAARKAAS